MALQKVHSSRIDTHEHSGADVTSGTVPDARMPTRLGTVAKTVTDWNDATEAGWYMGNGVTNTPAAGWWMGIVEVHNSNYIIQTLCDFDGAQARWRRVRNAGTWGSWYKVLTEKYTVSTSDASGTPADGDLWYKV
jgi:hypothetical protein